MTQSLWLLCEHEEAGERLRAAPVCPPHASPLSPPFFLFLSPPFSPTKTTTCAHIHDIRKHTTHGRSYDDMAARFSAHGLNLPAVAAMTQYFRTDAGGEGASHPAA